MHLIMAQLLGHTSNDRMNVLRQSLSRSQLDMVKRIYYFGVFNEM